MNWRELWRHLQTEKGFTLLEALISLLIMGLTLSYILPGFFQVVELQTYLTAKTEASILGQGKLEEIINKAELAQEGVFPEPWAHFHWRYDEERLAESLTRGVLIVRWEGYLSEKQVIIYKLRVEE